MKKVFPLLFAIAAAVSFPAGFALAQDSVAPATPQDMEAMYNAAIENRTENILQALGLTNSMEAVKVHDLIIAQYRTLKSRDAAIDALLKYEGKEVNYPNRASFLAATKPIHEKFIASLSALLTPQQVEIVKDKLTYNKVKVTYDAYCAIVPDLTDADKVEIMEKLKAAREEAMDGGTAGEKSDIFQKYKDQINDYLNAHGHDVAKAYKDWNAKQQAAAGTPHATN